MALTLEDWLPNNKLGQDIWKKKYQFNGETFDAWLDRVSAGNQDIKDLILDKKFLFAGRILANRGLQNYGKKVTYSNCYDVPSPEDNLESIFDVAKFMARIFSYGGGCGTGLYKLRPINAPVNNAAEKSSGSISFADLYNITTAIIAQKGRRGATMLYQMCNHPDVEAFVALKHDLDKLEKVNISVGMLDDFMRAVIEDTNYDLVFEDKVYKTISARDLLSAISYEAWDTGDPGTLFIDRIKNWCICSQDPDFEFDAPNPCVTGDTQIFTVEYGYQPIKNLVGKDVHVYSMNEEGSLAIALATNIHKTRKNADLMKIVTLKGTLRCTPDHLIYVVNKGWVKAKDLKHGDKLKGLSRRFVDDYKVVAQIAVLDDVEEVQELSEKEDVYDLTVPEFHNFLANDIIVHNCGEQPLQKWGSCNLCAINLSNFVVSPFDKNSYFDFTEFAKVVKIAVVEMNKLIDEGMYLHPFKEQQFTVKRWRNMGIGIMGMADMLIKLGIEYGSEEHINISNSIGKTMIQEALKKSCDLAEIDGAFPFCDIEHILKSPFIKANASPDLWSYIRKWGLRNCSLLTIAPTGTLSTMLGISGGIEPLYDISYMRKTQSLHDGEDVFYPVYSQIVEDYAEYNHLTKNDKGEYENLPDFITNSTAKKLDWHNRVNVQGTWQKYIDSAISSTVNLPNSATAHDVYSLYIYAWQQGCKGLTVFRDGCRRAGVLTSSTEKPKKKVDATISDKSISDISNKGIFDNIIPVSRHEMGETFGSTVEKRVACGNMFITINKDKAGNLAETFINTSKSGQCKACVDGINRLISYCLRGGLKVEGIIDQLKGIRCDSCRTLIAKGEKLDGISCPDCVARVLEEIYARDIKHDDVKEIKPDDAAITAINKGDMMVCPDCGEKLQARGACPVCPNCGWSSCG